MTRLFLKMPPTINDNFVSPQTADGIGSRPLKLRYFDRLLQQNMTVMAVCDDPAMSPQGAAPLVTCRTTHVSVKLPHETKLRKVKELGKDQVVVSMLIKPFPVVIMIGKLLNRLLL